MTDGQTYCYATTPVDSSAVESGYYNIAQAVNCSPIVSIWIRPFHDHFGPKSHGGCKFDPVVMNAN